MIFWHKVGVCFIAVFKDLDMSSGCMEILSTRIVDRNMRKQIISNVWKPQHCRHTQLTQEWLDC